MVSAPSARQSMVTLADPVQRTLTGWETIGTNDTFAPKKIEDDKIATGSLLAGNDAFWILSHRQVNGSL